MLVCRMIFRKDIGKLLLKLTYLGEEELPTIEQEIETFTALNGYNPDALQVVDLLESDPLYHLAQRAKDIKWRNGELEFIDPQEPEEPEIVEEISLLEQVYAELLYQTALLELQMLGGM